jgi:hypothetical protein
LIAARLETTNLVFVDEMAATLVRKYAHPEGRVAATMGIMQVLPNGNVFIGWGSKPLFSECSRDGELPVVTGQARKYLMTSAYRGDLARDMDCNRDRRQPHTQ